MARHFSPRNTFYPRGGRPSELSADEVSPASPDQIPVAVPEDASPPLPNDVAPPIRPQPASGAPMGSALEVGVSPWMGRSDKPQEANLSRPYSTALVSVSKTPLFQTLQTGQSKEYRVAERKRRAADQEVKEQELARWEEENLPRCRYFFYIGCFGLPLLHFVSVYYYLRQLRHHDPNFKIRKYVYLSLLVGIIQVFVWILWIVVFQLLRDDDSLKSINILNFNEDYIVGRLA